MSNIPLVCFNKGLVTPHVDARNDSEAYQSACRVLDNWIARMYGSAERRPGTYYIGGMRSSDDTTPVSGVTTCLLLPFIYSEEIAYVLEFTGYYIRAYYGDAIVDEIDSPYAEEDLFDLQFRQLGDVIRITHKSYQQRIFSRLDVDVFSLDYIDCDYGPFLKRNDLSVKDGCEMTITGTGLTVTNASDTTYSASVNSNTAYRAFDQNTDTFWSFRYDDSWIQCAWDSGVAIKAIRILCSYVKRLEVWAGDTVGGLAKIAASSWTTGCKEYGTGDTEITSAHPRNYARFVLDNVTEYKIWRIVFTDDYEYGTLTREKIIQEIQMSEDATEGDDDDAVLESSLPVFEEGHVGALFSITQPRVNCAVTISQSGTGSSDSILVDGIAVLSVSAGWIGTIKLERQHKGETEWETAGGPWTAYDTNRVIQKTITEEEENVYYRITISAFTSGTVSGDLTVDDPTHTGICKVTEYVDEYTVKVIIIVDFVSGETSLRWAEGAWSDVRGYPSSCCFIEDRCVYGGMKALANGTSLATVWMSATGDYENFDEGTNGADSLSVTIMTTETLVWVDAMDNLLVGTTGGIFMIRSSRMDAVIVPNPPPISRQVSAYPCDAVQPVKMMKAMVYLSGRQLRELTYDRGSYSSDNDLTALCEQITASPIVNMSLQTNPDTILWCVHADGRLSAFVYDRENNVAAWANMPLALSGGGIVPKVKSVAVIPDYGHGDDIYVAVHRIINGKAVMDGDEPVMDGDEEVRDKMSVIYVEKMAKRFE